MKLGELCKVINAAMFIKYSDGKSEDLGFWVHGITFQQKLYRCKDFARWDVVGITVYPSESNKVIVGIVKPEEPGSDRKPAKFKVGSDYKEDSGSGIIRIVGKFRSPTDGNVYVAIERPGLQTKDPEIFLVNTEGIGDEYICEFKNEQTFKYKALDLI